MAALAGVFRKAGVGNRWRMWLSLDVTLVLLGSHPVLTRTHLDMRWLPLLGRTALYLIDNDSFCKPCVFGDGDLLEWLLGLIFLFLNSRDLFFFAFNLDDISCIQISFLQTWGQNHQFSCFIRINFSAFSEFWAISWSKVGEINRHFLRTNRNLFV